MVDESVYRACLASELRAAMGREQMSQTEMAHKTGISLMTVSRHYRGVGPMTAYQQRIYADALGTFWTTDDDGLPRLDSNQQPFDLPTEPVAALASAS